MSLVPRRLVSVIMKPERWQQVDKLFQAALALDAADRASFLDHACKSDHALRSEVQSLLDSHDSAGSFISSAAIEANPSLIATNTKESILQQRLGPYLILSQIGMGGMGEVYLAQDTRLGRKVALKLLPDYFTRDEQRVRRFQQEARAASALNHPSIITIHDIGEADGRHFIATEFVDGETLRQVMARDRMKISESLDIAIQAASALASAHQAGIVHRDIKPENIMVRPDGLVKVLDFGLAKLTEGQDIAAGTQAPTLARVNTDPGTVMGTVNYMSPEQARGHVVDARSDIFSLGVVLYEMVAGRAPFEGESASDVIAAILQNEPAPVTRYEPEASAELQWIITKALRKDREDRFQTVKEMLSDLREVKEELQHQAKLERSALPETAGKVSARTGVGQTTAETADERAIQTGEGALRTTSSAEYLVSQIKRHKRGIGIALTMLAVAIAGVTLLMYRVGQNRAKPAVPFQVGKADRLTYTGKALDAAISPDGKFVVYVLSEAGQESLWTRDVATNSNVQVVPPAEIRYRGINFSPDGNYVYYVRLEMNSPVGVVYQVPKLGGATRKILADVSTPVTFSPDGKRFAFVRSLADEDVLVLANADGTGEQKLAALKSPESFSGGPRPGAAVPGAGPAWSPDGKVIACPARIKDVRGGRTLVEVRVADGTVKPIAATGWGSIQRVEWLRDGTGLIVCADNSPGLTVQIWYLAYPGGESRMITHDLNNYVGVSLSADSSTLVAVEVEFLSNVWVAGFNQVATNARQITNGKLDGYCGVSWTADDKIVYAARRIKYADLWVMDANGGNQKQLMDDEPTDRYPSVTPDARYIVFDSLARADGIWRMDSDGSNIKRLTDRGMMPHCSPDGKWVTYQGPEPSAWKVSIDGGQPVRLTDKITSRPAFSPDGKRIACLYREGRTSPWEIAVFPSEGGRPIKVFDNPVTVNRWVVFRWTPDGRAILYVDEREGVSNIWSQPVEGGKPAQVTDFKSDLIYTFDLSRDGKWLAVTRGTFGGDVVMMHARDFPDGRE